MRAKSARSTSVLRAGGSGISASLVMMLAGVQWVGAPGLIRAAQPEAQPGGDGAKTDEKQPEKTPEKPTEKPAQPGAGELETEETLARFQQLLEKRPFHGPAFTGLVNHAVERGKLKELIDDYQAKVTALPGEVALKIVLARLQLRAGDAAAAGAILEKIEHLEGDLSRMNGDLLVLKAEVDQRLGDNAGAEKMLKEAQGLAQTVSERLRLGEALADLYIRDNRKDDAVKVLEGLAAEFPDNYAHQKHVAEAMAQRGLHEAAVARYKAMLPLVKDEVDRRCEVLRAMGQSLERLDKRDEAIAAYVEAVGLLSSDHWLQKELHERIVALYRAANRLEDLAAYCKTQIARAPEQTAMRVLLADVQNAMGDPEKAKQTLSEAVTLFPKDEALSQKRVEFLERVGDIDGVSAEYERIIGQHPDDIELYVAYGQGLANSKRIDAARNQWRHVLNTRVDDAALAIRLGGLFESYELYDDAAEAYERAITVNPRQPDGYTALARLWQVRGDAEKAVAALSRMGEANPKDGSVQAALAQELRNLGKTDEALAAITKACDLLPDQVKYQTIRSDLLIQSGQLEEALKVRRAAIDRMTNPVQQADAVGTLVSMYASAGKLADLRKQEEEKVGADAGAKVPLMLLAQAADVDRDFPSVRKHLDALLKADPGNETALQQMAKLQDATGDIDAAIGTYTQLVQRYPARARRFYDAIVDLKLRYGDRAGAIESLQKMAQDDPTSAATQAGVGEQLVRMNEPERALPFFEKALQIQPDRHETRLDYGKALVDAGRLDDAVAAFRAVATQRSDMDRALEALGRLHDTASQLGKLEELIDELEHQVDADPSNTLVASALARLLVQELEYGRALEVLDGVLRNNPRDVNLAMTRAEVLRRLARYDEAVAGYQNILHFPQIDRDFVQGELGKTYFESGQVDQARRVWKQIQNKLYAGSLLKNNGLIEESIKVLEEGVRLKPDEYAIHRNLIDAYEAAGRTPEALSAARRLLDLEPGNIWNIERLAEAYMRSGDRAGAASVASRLFSAGVSPDKPGAQGAGGGGYQSFAGAMYSASYSGSGYYGSGGGGRSNLERGIQFFMRNGLRAELEDVLNQQLAAQVDNAVLKETAADLFAGELNKPEVALKLLRELETASFPVEHQAWLGQCSQEDWMRIKEYNLIATKPVLRDREIATLEAKKAEELTRDERIELAVIRKAQGKTEDAAKLLGAAVGKDSTDTLALGILTDLLVASERYNEAEPHARRLVEVLGERREQMHAATVERVRRDYVRSLPLEFQLRVNEELLSDIADKWTLGQGWGWYDTESTQAVGYLRAKLTLGTILAETSRMEEARKVWQELAPAEAPDVDRLTMLGDTAQLHQQEDLAFDFYERALKAAKKLAGDPLLQQVYASSATTRSWYGEEGVDKAFSSIVEAFSKRKALVELYDFLRDTDQEQRARRVAEQYKLGDELKKLYETRVTEAAAAFRKAPGGAMGASPAYFAQVCKLAELYDREGNWEGAQKVYEAYLKDFPDELGLLGMLGEVAEARLKTDEAIAWEKKVLECKERLARRAREWSLRELAITPSIPQALAAGRVDAWSWSNRWGKNRWSYGPNRDELERWPSWLRLAQLHLSAGNTIAAADAMQQAVAEAGAQRDEVVRSETELIQQRQLTTKMLPVLRSLAVYAPSNERVQLTFAESLEANGKKDLALEVCNRMLRRGVSDLGVLAEVKRHVQTLSPEKAAPEVTLKTLEAAAAADPGNLKARLQLAKAYYYSLNVDQSLAVVLPLVKEAPHLEDVHDLLVEIYTLRGDSDKLIEALKAKIDRASDEQKRRAARWRLVDELLAAGRNDEALATVKELGDPRDPRSYSRIGTLLEYFGKSDEAIACLEEGKKSRSANRYEGGGDFGVAEALALRGDFAGAADRVMAAIDEQSRQQTQYGGMYGMVDSGQNPFTTLEPLFALYPELAGEVSKRVQARRDANPADAQALKLLMGLKKSLGRPDQAEALLEQVAQGGSSDQGVVMQQIDLAVRRREFAKAVDLAQKFIAQAPKPQVPPGMPAQYAGYAVLQSPRTFMLCKLGDVYWEMGEKEKAFEAYKQIEDKKVDETRVAYATICLMHGRADEAKKLVDEALGDQQVKPPALLQFRAFIAALENDPGKAFDLLAEAAIPGGEQENPYGGGGSALQSLSWMATRAGQMDKFATFMKDRIKKNPADWENYQTLANAYWEAGRPDEALALMDEAGKVASLAQQALTQRLTWRQACAPVDELIPMYQKLIEMSEKDVQSNASARYNPYDGGSDAAQGYRDELADLFWSQGKKEDAERLWTERMNAQRADAHLRLGRLYAKKEAYDKAQAEFARAAELDPDNVPAHMALAREAYVRGDKRALLEQMHECFVRRPSAEDQQNQYRGYYQQDDEDQQRDPGRMSGWALSLIDDPEVASYLESGEVGEQAGEYRIMLATLTGRWDSLDTLLKPLIAQGTMDPLVWKLWAQVEQRKGEWAEAAKALDFLRRVKLTTLGNYRERLKLVLAGKQLKEAAAGTRQAPTNTPAVPGMPSGYSGYQPSYYGGYYSGYDDWWSGGADSSLLPSLCIKLGDFKRAERLYLLSSGGDGVGSRLPWLASLMWDQQAKDRALELMRLALAFPSDRYGGSRNMIPQYAAMLSEAGQAKAATELLVRTYRFDSSNDENNFNAAMYGYAYGQGQEFEQGNELQVASSLSGILKRAGTFDQELKDLSAESAKDPGDPRLAKLVLSLQKQGRKWAEQKESLAARRAALPADEALALEQYHTACQLGQWDEALGLVGELRKLSPKSGDRWDIHEAFVQLMRHDGPKAVAAIEPLLNRGSGDEDYGAPPPLAAPAVLAAAGDLERLEKYLAERRGTGELDESGKHLLARVMLLRGEWNEALGLTLEEFWKQPRALGPGDRWWGTLTRVMDSAQRAGATPKPGAERPADAALLTLAGEGAQAGLTAFEALAAKPDASLEALRGLVLAASMAGDDKKEAEANERLLAWLAPRRMAAWYVTPGPSLQKLAKAVTEQMGRSGATQAALGSGMGQSIGSLFQSGSAGGDTQTYDALYVAHAKRERALLARAGEADRLDATLKEQARTLQSSGYSNNDYGYDSYRYMPRGNRYGNDESEQMLASDRGAFERALFWSAGRLDTLLATYEKAGARIPSNEWRLRGEAAAVAGKSADAQEWRRRFAFRKLTQLRATEHPDLGASSMDPWRWSWYYEYGSGSQDIQTIRQALRVSTSEEHDADTSSTTQGQPDQIWEVALVDPVVEKEMLRDADAIGPGWGGTQTAQNLVSYFKAKEDPARVIALVEKATEKDQILRSPLLSEYLWACFRAKDSERLEAVLGKARQAGAALANDIDLARLVELRLAGKGPEADQLESTLLGRCVVETRSPFVIDPALTDPPWPQTQEQWGGQASYYNRYRYPEYRQGLELGRGFRTAPELAQMLGIRFDAKVQSEDLTVAHIRSAYERHGLYSQAARLLEREIRDAAPSPERQGLMAARARALLEADNKEEAGRTARELEGELRAEASKSAANAGRVEWRLAQLYASKAYGPDFAKAYQALSAARKAHPECDPAGVQAVHCLYKLGKFAEAWDTWRAGRRDSRYEAYQEPTIYYAAIAACRGGQKDAGIALARQALYKYPESPLAKETRELIDEH